MPLPGIRDHDEMDYPATVRESVTILPFFSGGTTQLAVAGTPEDLVLVSALRRFENRTFVARGTHTPAGASATVLTDSTASFLDWGVEVGDTVNNTTDGSTGVLTGVTATTLTVVALTGGAGNNFEQNDVYNVAKTLSHQSAFATEIRKIRIITDLEVYIELDGEANVASHLFHLNPGDSISEEGTRVVSRISFLNVVATERPELRWWVWGIN